TPHQPPPVRVPLRSRPRPADTPLRVFHVGAPPPVRKRSPARTPSQPPIAPEAGAPTAQSVPRRHAAMGIPCRSTAPGAKTEPSQNTKPPPIAPGAGAPTVPSVPRPTHRYGYFL